MYRERSIGIPEAIRVANWREKTARLRMLTLLKRWKMSSSFSASRCSETSRTISPRWRSCSETWALLGLELAAGATPARSTARKVKVLAPAIGYAAWV